MPTNVQEFAKRILKAHIQTERLAHAYLFQGVWTEAMKAVFLDLGKSLNCEKGKSFEDCDCLSCKKINASNHPDMAWVGEDLKLKSIKIEDIRNLIHATSLKPFEGKAKIFNILGAQRMTPDAANAFLKTLEEPPQVTFFLLQTENKSGLLETIRSRCFEIRMPTPEPEEAAPRVLLPDENWMKWLEQYQSMPKNEIQETLSQLLSEVQHRMHRETLPAQSGRWIQAIEKIGETKEALEQNANQKLALTRLAIHLEKQLVGF